GSDGNIYLLSKANRNVFVWSPASRSYLAPVPLQDIPLFIAYDSARHVLYATYEGGMVTSLDLATDRVERPFVNTPQTAMGLAFTDNFLFAVDPSGAWVRHYTYTLAGALANSREWNYYSSEYIW